MPPPSSGLSTMLTGPEGSSPVQVNPANYRDPARMVDQALQFAEIAPNIHVKLPATAAGIVAMEEATARGVNINSTVSFTMSQALSAAEAVERGLERQRRRRRSRPLGLSPSVTIMIGRLDDWMKAVIERDNLAVDPAAPNWAGIAVFKRAYAVFRERRYRSRLLAAATRHPLHWTELVGGDVAMTLTHQWQVCFERAALIPNLAWITQWILPFSPNCLRAFPTSGEPTSPMGSLDEFDGFGATVRTLRAFIASYHDLQATVRRSSYRTLTSRATDLQRRGTVTPAEARRREAPGIVVTPGRSGVGGRLLELKAPPKSGMPGRA